MLGQLHINPELHAAVERSLDPGERIDWIEMPKPSHLLPEIVGGSIVGAVLTAVAVSIAVSGIRAGTAVSSSIGAGVVGLFGLVLLLLPVGIYWMDRRTVYAITDRRAIIITKGLVTTIDCVRPDQINSLSRVERRDNLGDVVMSRYVTRDSEGAFNIKAVGFYNIRDPRAVETRLRHLAASRPAAPNCST